MELETSIQSGDEYVIVVPVKEGSRTIIIIPPIRINKAKIGVIVCNIFLSSIFNSFFDNLKKIKTKENPLDFLCLRNVKKHFKGIYFLFITNVVKCRPPGNRDPLPEEIDICTKTYLERQIQGINPKAIVTLGRYSMGMFLRNTRISDVHGQPFHIKGRLVIPMYHPAAALHQGSLRPVIESDFSKLPKLIVDAPGHEVEETKIDEEPKQLSLF